MANSVEALENNMNEVKRDVASNIARMEEAKTRIMSTEAKLETRMAEFSKASGWITPWIWSLRHGKFCRRKNLCLFGWEGEEGGQQLLDYMQEILPGWLGIDKSITSGKGSPYTRPGKTEPRQSSTRMFSEVPGPGICFPLLQSARHQAQWKQTLFRWDNETEMWTKCSQEAVNPHVVFRSNLTDLKVLSVKNVLNLIRLT